jgi:hypothetical protein
MEDQVTRLASDIREAGKPIFCSSCFNQKDIRHIDFDAACDRGYGKAEAVEVAMDDLILCEDCVREGAEILGMVDDIAQREQLAALERKVAAKDKELEKAERYAETMEDLLGQKNVRIDHRKKPRATREEVAA